MNDTKHIVALSGGKDSTAMALILAAEEPREYLYFCTPTGNEPPEMRDHWANLECILKSPITRITADTLENLIEKQNCLPSHRMRWCTRMLKIEPAIAFYRANAPCIAYVGLRADEPIDERGGIYGIEIEQRYPLRERGMTEDEVWDYLYHRGVQIPHRTDCEWCYDQTLRQWRKLKRDRPASYLRAQMLEQKTGHTFRSPSRDTQPAALKILGEKFDSGFIPRGDTDQMSMFEAPEFRKCRVCSL